MENVPQIRKVVFILDRTRRYSFDVNQNISIHNLKRMITSAANLSRATLRIYHNGTEYTHREYENLDMLFPDKKVVEFTLGVDFTSEEELDSLLQIRLNRNYCPLHDAKYPYFYCYSCYKSICSACLLSGEHSGHIIKEKYDCLQSSRILIEKIFQDIKINLEKINDDKINEIQNIISFQFSSELVQIVKEIENKFMNLVTAFVYKEKDNIDKIKTNLTKLKQHCTDGLDTFKNEHEIEDLIIDEQLFLVLDSKFNDIAKEKNFIKKDISKCEAYSKILDIIINQVNKSYEEIKAFLQRYLKSDIYDKIRSQIEETIVNDIKKEDIIERISTNKKLKPFHEMNSPRSFEPKYEEETMENNDHFTYKKNPSKLSTSPNKSKKIDIELLLCQPKENTPNVSIYLRTFDKRESILHQTIQHSLISNPTFPINCAWYNYKNKLYISGGYIEEQMNTVPSKIFYEYNPVTNSLLILPDMPERKQGHSMCMDSYDNLYVIGGNSNSILKYNITSNTWTTLQLKLSTQRNHPSCFIKENNMLYVFYGVNNSQKFVNSIEKGNLYSGGECVIVNRDKNSLLHMGIIPYNKNSLILIGGLNEKGQVVKTQKIFKCNNNTIDNSKFFDDNAACFHQSVLPELGNGSYGYFSLEREMTFIKYFMDDLI